MPKKLEPGQIAPSFSSTDVMGKKVDLTSNKSKYVLVVFLRYAGCPWCNLAIHRLALEQKLLRDNNCTIIAFVQSSKENIIKNIYDRHEQKPLFQIVADHEMENYKKYLVHPSAAAPAKLVKSIPYWVHAVRKGGFKNGDIDGNLFMVPASFLIAPYSRKILRADYTANLYEHSTFSKIYDTIARHKLEGDVN